MSNDRPKHRPDGNYLEDLDLARSAWSQLEQAEPPELLDQAVLNAARRAAANPRRRPSVGWLGALATAAVVVLTLTLVVRQDPQGPAPPVPQTDGFELELRSKPPTAAREAPIRKHEAAPRTASEALVTPPQDTPVQEESAMPSAAADALSEEDAVVPEPEAWIEHMLHLKESGRQDQLNQELAVFRKTYPDFVLPPELLE
jgi:hypothetical protein